MSNPTSYTWDIAEDAVKPFILNVEVINAFTLRVIYSEAIIQSEASNPLNYSVNNGLIIQTITAESAASYLVTTSQQIAGQSYTLTVTNVHDLFGNVT